MVSDLWDLVSGDDLRDAAREEMRLREVAEREIERLRATIHHIAQRKQARDVVLASRHRYVGLGFDIMAEIRACPETIEDDALACPCTISILSRIKERDDEIERLRARVAELEADRDKAQLAEEMVEIVREHASCYGWLQDRSARDLLARWDALTGAHKVVSEVVR